jgi:diacylglycerol kinase (ATP)
MKPAVKGLKRLLHALTYSRQGLVFALRNEAAFRQELAVAVVLVPVAFWLPHSLLHTAALIGVLLLVMVVELLNSAVEAVVDRIGPEHHELAGRAKDMGSAAVLLSLVIALVVWVAVILESL